METENNESITNTQYRENIETCLVAISNDEENYSTETCTSIEISQPLENVYSLISTLGQCSEIWSRQDKDS